ncbi:MAG TPA: hypothetical protein VHA52_09570, partial [Candidatus Babeliaceae bacterium]|nr:hypothetical protein [Candidatus Babeliaceae bacterium]
MCELVPHTTRRLPKRLFFISGELYTKSPEKLPIHSFERIAYIASGLEGKQRMRFIQNASAKKYITSSQYKYLKKCGLPPRDISDAIERQRHIPKRYNHYIRSKFWAERCDRYWQTHRKCCAICGATQYVQLHHTVYSHFGDEPDENLVALCG